MTVEQQLTLKRDCQLWGISSSWRILDRIGKEVMFPWMGRPVPQYLSCVGARGDLRRSPDAAPFLPPHWALTHRLQPVLILRLYGGLAGIRAEFGQIRL